MVAKKDMSLVPGLFFLNNPTPKLVISRSSARTPDLETSTF